jgi:DNA-binding CsgD family transcriptional regulator
MGSMARSGLTAVLDSIDLGSTGDPSLLPVAEALAAVMAAETVSVFELDLGAAEVRFGVDTDTDESNLGEEPQPEDRFWRFFWSGACSYTEPSSPYFRGSRRTAIVSPPRLHASRRAYEASAEFEYDREGGLGEYVIVPLLSASGSTRRVLLNRPLGDRPFGPAELDGLRLLQPHLDAGVRHARQPVSLTRLTEQEQRVLSLVRSGDDNRAIAARLHVTPNTVRKHLENSYAKLGVHSRTAAVAVVFGN